MAEIFLSYSRRDSHVMRRLRNDLRRYGFTVWTDEGLMPGTKSWQCAIKQALEEASCLVVILSPDAQQSKWVEIVVTHAEEVGLPIFQVLARGTEQTAILFSLQQAQRVDIRDEYQQVTLQLVPALRRHLQRGQSTGVSGEHTVASKQPFVSPTPDPIKLLSLRDLEICKLMVAGYPNADIARHLNVSRQAVSSYVRRISSKLRVHSRAELIAYLLQSGQLAFDDGRQPPGLLETEHASQGGSQPPD